MTIVITSGDPSGIGPEVIQKSWTSLKRDKDCNFSGWETHYTCQIMEYLATNKKPRRGSRSLQRSIASLSPQVLKFA